MNRIDERFAALRKQGRKGFVAYIGAGDPNLEATRQIGVAFDKAGVKVLVGDWTSGDPAITRFLESRGRAGVPLYLWYQPGKEPEELPQILTPAMLIDRALRQQR